MWFRYFVASCSLIVSFSAHAIINGRNADKIKSASTVSIHFGSTESDCSGVIISEHLILTAGHCFDQQSQNLNSVGISNNTRASGSWKNLHLAQSFGRHPKYIKPSAGGKKNSTDIQYDFAYLKVTENLLKTFDISQEQLPRLFTQTSAMDTTLASSNLAMAYGYGLSKVSTQMSFINPPEDPVKRELQMTVTHNSNLNILVARSTEDRKGLCSGDSGGGLFMTSPEGQTYLAGIVSGIGAGAGCGSKESYGAYSIVTQHLCWVFQDSGSPVPPELSALNCN